jgi:hypothetical protein
MVEVPEVPEGPRQPGIHPRTQLQQLLGVAAAAYGIAEESPVGGQVLANARALYRSVLVALLEMER